MISTKLRLSNHLPEPGADFPTPWVGEFEQELVQSALRRVRIVALTLIVIETYLIALDLYQWPSNLPDIPVLLVWRATVWIFLLTFLVLVSQRVPDIWRLRYFLGMGMLLACWVSALLAEVTGDLSTFTIGALGMAAACPLPGRFNVSLFVLSGGALIGWLWFHFPAHGSSYWFSNIATTCVIGMVIEHLMFQAALRDFTQRKGIERQRERADSLLYNVFPESVAAALKHGNRSVASHGEVTILFADVVGFTQLASRMLPSQLLSILEQMFEQFDGCAQRHGIEKIKTIGDAYMAIAGAPITIDRPIERMADFAIDIMQVCRQFAQVHQLDLRIRIGMHCGPVIAGVIGSSRLCYDLWGDAVNTAQRIESHGLADAINVSEPVYYALRAKYQLEDRGMIELKGKGPTRLFVLCDKRQDPAIDSASNSMLQGINPG